MREQYLGRVNRFILITHAVTTFFLVMGLVSQLTSAVSGMEPIQSIIPIIGALVVFLGGVVMFLRFRRTIIYTRYVGIAFSAYYILLFAMAASNTPFTYILPIMFILVFSFDVSEKTILLSFADFTVNSELWAKPCIHILYSLPSQV